MKPFRIAIKTLTELWREPLLLGLLIAFPVLLVGFYYIAFSGTNEGLSTYLTIYAIDEDEGVSLEGGVTWNAGAQLIDTLRTAEWEGFPIFEVQEITDRRLAEIALRERNASLLLVVPPNFGRTLHEAAQGQSPATSLSATTTTVTLAGFPASDSFIFAENILVDYLREFANHATSRAAAVQIDYQFIPGTGGMSDFDFGVPGIIVFGVMFLAITTAEVMVRENVNGTLRRLRLAGVSAANLLSGVALSQFIVVLAIVPITLGTAMAMGFRGQGSLWLAMLIGALLGLAAIGLGLLTACFARNDGEAANGSAAILVVMVLLSGALYPMPEAPIATIAGRTFQVYDLLPTTHASEAMRQVLVFGADFHAIAFEVGAMTILSLAILAAGIALYGRLRLNHT